MYPVDFHPYCLPVYNDLIFLFTTQMIAEQILGKKLHGETIVLHVETRWWVRYSRLRIGAFRFQAGVVSVWLESLMLNEISI